jgi:hypothetical protein
MMETGYEVGSATLVYLSDGTVGLYFSTGGGMLGTTDNVPIAEAVKALVIEAQAHIQMTAPSETIPLPEPGQVRFTLLTYNDKLTVTAKERALVDNDHPLNALYQAGHQVMNELHSMVEKGKTIHGRSHLSE